MKKNLVLIKLGGSLITDKSKPFTARRKRIQTLVKELQKAQKKSEISILLAHGSGSFGHTVASKYKTSEGIINNESINGFPLVADSAIQINRIVMKELLSIGLPAVSFSPLSFLSTNNKVLSESFIKPIEGSLKLGLIPVVYGDVVMDKKQGFCIYSGETTLDLLACQFSKSYNIEKVIQVGNTDGVYDTEGHIIPTITSSNFEKFKHAIGGSGSTDVTGGMIHKVEEGLKLASKTGVSTLIINGDKKEHLMNAILNKKVIGTLITK